MSKGISYWITTDTHLGHKEMIQYCGRPEDFEQKIFKNMQKCMNPDDIMIHLGDVCMKNESFWHEKLIRHAPRTRWLVRGNHDSKSYVWYTRNGWSFAGETFSLIYRNKHILFSHKPYPIKDFDLNIYGHFHNNPVKKWEPHLKAILTNKHYLLVIEDTHYSPMSLNQIITEYQKKLSNRMDMSNAMSSVSAAL